MISIAHRLDGET